jgi:hypothetical protein
MPDKVASGLLDGSDVGSCEQIFYGMTRSKDVYGSEMLLFFNIALCP